MSIALDIGTSRLRSLRREGVELIGRSTPATFSLIADDPSSRGLLTRAELAFATGEGELALVGDAALEHAAAFRATPLPLLPGGMVPSDDPPARQLLGTIIESLLPEAEDVGSPCGLILPVASMTDEASAEFIARLVRMRGYEPLPLTETHALALATLSAERFSGISIVMGAGGCSMSLIHRGRELAGVQEPRGTAWIDALIASAGRRYAHGADGERYLDTESVRRQRESLADPLTRPTTDFASRVAEHYRELLHTTAREFAASLRRDRLGRFETPLSVVCAGGGTRPAGFAALLTAALVAAELPFVLGPTKLAPCDEYVVARGALIHAELNAVSLAAA
ncbi:MAG: hypothetical protein M3552_16195 [Planctomycetota bacterium]|nr:hypothetical protein [Planctomycetaceae bacterium]MDQ3332168.1 hypothetical protein [Planctomycetota bacterium]